jgi:hypothetical protein
MHVDIKVEEFNVGGIKIQARSLSSFPGSGNLPVTVFFLLHGRQDSQKDVFYLAEATLNHVKDQVECGATPAKELVVVTFVSDDHDILLTRFMLKSRQHRTIAITVNVW